MKRSRKKPRGKRNKMKFVASISDDKKVVTIAPTQKTAKYLSYISVE